MYIGNLNIVDGIAFTRASRDLDLLARGEFSPIKTALKKAYPKSDLPVSAIPFAQRYVTELSGLYDRPVVRRFSPGGLDQAIYSKLQAVYAASKIDAAMSTIEKALWTQNTVLGLVMPQGIGRVRLQHILPWQVTQVDVADAMAADDPASWTRLLAQVPASAVGGQVIMGELELTRTHAWRQSNGDRVGIYNADGSHPFGVVPILVAHRITPDSGWWRGPINEAVLNLQIGLSLQATDDQNIVKSCAFPQRYIRNATIAQQVEEMTLGPDKVLALVRSGNPDDPAPELAIVQGQVPVAELVSFAEHKIRLYCAMLGIDPSSFLRVNTAVTASARLFSAQDRKAIRDRLHPVLRQFENQLARMITAVLELREPMELAGVLGANVTWSIPEPSADPVRDQQAIDAGIGNGTTAPSDYVANRDGLSPVAALAKVERNLAESRALGLIADPAADQLEPADG